MAGEWRTASVADLQRGGVLLVEDGNHGEYRPRPDEFVEVGVAFIRAADMDGGRVLFESASKINDQARQRITKGIGTPGRSVDPYEMVEIIKALQNDPSTNPDDLFRVEWAYLPLLDKHNDASPKLLERRLAEDPGFFCEVIRLVFRSKKEERVAEEPTEETKNIATNAYRLLSGWRIPPGLREDGAYDGDALNAWLEAMKTECTETGHLEIAMTMVGHALVHVPPDPDGLWIHRSAAAALNAKDAGDMRDGFRTELYNSRGAHYVDPTGKPERDLAAKYRAQAEAIDGAGYPRLATTLRELADTYEREAERVSSRGLFDD